MYKITAAFFMVVVASGCMGNGEAPIVDDAGGQTVDLAPQRDGGNTAVDMTKTDDGPVVLNPAPVVPIGIPQVQCTGFDSRISVWGPATNGSYVRISSVNNRLIARYEDHWNGNVDPNCYDVTPVSSGLVGNFSQGRYPYDYVLVFIGAEGFITKDGWTFTKVTPN